MSDPLWTFQNLSKIPKIDDQFRKFSQIRKSFQKWLSRNVQGFPSFPKFMIFLEEFHNFGVRTSCTLARQATKTQNIPPYQKPPKYALENTLQPSFSVSQNFHYQLIAISPTKSPQSVSNSSACSKLSPDPINTPASSDP